MIHDTASAVSRLDVHRRGGLRMQLEGPTADGFMYSDTGGDGPVVVLLHGCVDERHPVGQGGRRPGGSLPLHRPGAAVRRAHHADVRRRRRDGQF